MKRLYVLIITLSLILNVSILILTEQATGAQDIDFDLDYSDPASDVTWVYGNGSTEMRSDPKDVNIKWLRSEMQSETLKLTIELNSPGVIRTDNITIYKINLYTTLGNATHFIVNYSNGNCNLRTNTSSAIINDSVEHSISGSALECLVDFSELGNVTYFNIDASAETREYENDTVGWVLKKDFGWELSGSPGTIPGEDPEGEETPGFLFGSMLLATIIAVVIISFVRKEH